MNRFTKKIGQIIAITTIIFIFFYFIERKLTIDVNIKDILKKVLFDTIIIVFSFVSLKVLIRRLIKSAKQAKYLSSPLSQIDKMTGQEFEEYLKAHFERMGYKTMLTNTSHDYGADLVCKRKSDILIIQTKRYNNKVGNAAIQEIVAAKAYYQATRCMVVTNSYFTAPAIRLAESNGVELWDRNSIEKLCK